MQTKEYLTIIYSFEGKLEYEKIYFLFNLRKELLKLKLIGTPFQENHPIENV